MTIYEWLKIINNIARPPIKMRDGLVIHDVLQSKPIECRRSVGVMLFIVGRSSRNKTSTSTVYWFMFGKKIHQ